VSSVFLSIKWCAAVLFSFDGRHEESTDTSFETAYRRMRHFYSRLGVRFVPQAEKSFSTINWLD
jgi:hypothetical protein